MKTIEKVRSGHGAASSDNVRSIDAVNMISRVVALWLHVGIAPLLGCGPMDARQQRRTRREQPVAPPATKTAFADRSPCAASGGTGSDAPIWPSCRSRARAIGDRL
jgi:hypothetical protein